MAKGNFIEYVISDDPNKYPNESEQDGYYYRKVTKVETEEQTVTAGTTLIEVIPSAGKLISKVNINPTPTESKSVTPTTSEVTVTPSEGKYLSQVVVGAVEDITPEVTAQTPVIAQIAENLGVTITTPSGTNKQILQGNNANLLNINNNAKKEGEYVWSKYKITPSVLTVTGDGTSGGNGGGSSIVLQILSSFVGNPYYDSNYNYVGIFEIPGLADIANVARYYYTRSDLNSIYYISAITTDSVAYTYWDSSSHSVSYEKTFLDYVVSDDVNAYPDKATHTDGYWYELYGSPLDIVTWADGTDEEIVAMVEAADQGLINLSDYWTVGDTRTVQLSAMSATGVSESQSAQEVDLVLMHAGGYELNEAVASGRTTCSFIVGQKDSLATAGYMNSSDTNSGSWDGSARRTWCNSVYKNALPSTLLPIFKQFKTITAQTYSGSANQESVDYFALPAAKEVFGGSASSAGSGTGYSNLNEFNALFQFDYYVTTSNRVKKLGKTGSANAWWGRSPYYYNSANFCYVDSGGAANTKSAGSSHGLAPFGCI